MSVTAEGRRGRSKQRSLGYKGRVPAVCSCLCTTRDPSHPMPDTTMSSPASTLHEVPVATTPSKGEPSNQAPANASPTEDMELKGKKLAAVFGTMMISLLLMALDQVGGPREGDDRRASIDKVYYTH